MNVCSKHFDNVIPALDGCWSLVSINRVLFVCPFDCFTVAGSGKIGLKP